MAFEWDPDKAAANLAKHGVSFSDAATAFRDPLSLTAPDPHHSDDESRFIIVGTSERGTLMMVAPTDRGERIRIISARRLTRAEREQYAEGF